MKSAALMLAAVLLLFLSPALALEPVVVVEEDSAVLVPKRLTTLVNEEPAAAISEAPLRLVQEESDAPAQPEPEPEQQPPEADQPAPEEQAQPEPPPAQEEQPEEPAQPPEPPAPMPQAPEMPMLRPSNPGFQQASATPVRIVATAQAQHAPAAPTQQVFTALAEQAPAAPAQENQQSDPSYVSEIASDFRYTVNNAEADVEDVVTAPLHIGEAGSLFSEPKFYYTLLGAGALLGGAFAADTSVRSRIRYMGHDDASDLETYGTSFEWGASGLFYLYGLYDDDARGRETMITGFEGAGVASLVTLAIENIFGRSRPRQGHGAFAFFRHGESFVSGAATPPFALAAGLSEYADNAWYVMVPAYAGAMTVGLGRMGHDAHWLSDIVGAAIVGVGTTELLLYMHRWHAENPTRFRIFPVSAPSPGPVARQDALQGLAPQGLGVSYEW